MMTESMNGQQLRSSMIEIMGKHLPPSASSLRFLDINGEVLQTLSTKRADLDAQVVSGDVDTWEVTADSMDAVLAYGYIIHDRFLQQALEALRPGGRMIVVDPVGSVRQEMVTQLESNGFVRILVEPVVDGQGVLIRGEKPHVAAADTLERVQSVAIKDGSVASLADFKGRYVHLLIQQSPNKPIWARRPDEVMIWKAAAIDEDDDATLLAFSSLPNAVSFMQSAVLAGKIRDVNKVGKFSKQVAENWPHHLTVNPTLDMADMGKLRWIHVDPATAEAPDE